MDEDDSQDELVNHSASQSKGKRAAMWAISDDSDDAGSDEEAESESGEDEEGEHLDGEDEDEDEDDDEDGGEEEEEEDGKPEEGACAGTSADHVEDTSDEEADKCPICLHSFNRQPVATPESCEHYFCLDCILEWSKNANSCPIDRINFKIIYLRTCYGGKVQKMITVQKPVKQCQQDTVDLELEETSCEVCGASDREDRLLLCDGCDAGYHMECLTPPLDAVPVEEWFCPDCQANNRQSRGSAEETSDSESLPSTARPASSRSRSHVAGPTRAIARTQHSERVRANVNRHRITQARTQEFAPTYLIRSTWLDETINAVVAGLNSAMYVRDLTPRATPARRRKTGKARKGNKTSSKTKNGKAASTGTRRRKRKARRTKSRKKQMMKKTATTRNRIANSLGIVKDKKSSSLPTVYRPSESTLSNMRADIGAASLSIYGDPFDLDPFVDREEDIQHAHDASLLEAKRRGISRSAFRSHQPVARPVSLSRRSVSIPQVGGVVEAAPVPDLLGSILSGQSMLLMDSSDVVINRDGSLKPTKPMSLTTTFKSDHSKSNSSGDADSQDSPGMLPDHVDRLGSSDSLLNGHLSPSSSHLSPIASTFGHNERTFHSHVPPRGSASLLGSLPNEPNRPNQRLAHQITNGVREHTPDSTSKSRTLSQSHSAKAPTKPMWVDVSELPRIPKIKRESSVDDAPSRNGSSTNNRRTGSSSSSSSSTNSYGMPETGINRLAGDKERRHSVDQQHGRTDSQRNRPEEASSSAGFSGSFSSSSSAASHANHQPCSSSSSTSVSFRISSSGNSWHSRRLNITSVASSGAHLQEQCKGKDNDEEERKRQLHRDKQKLLASRSLVSYNVYDPFNPTESDLSSSGDESDHTNVECNSRLKEESPSSENEDFSLTKKGQEKVETQTPRSQDKPRTTAPQETSTQELKYTKENVTVKKESRFKDTHNEKQNVPFKSTIKTEPESDEGETVTVKHEDNTKPVRRRWDLLKIKEETATDKEAPEMTDPPKDNNTSAASSSSQSRKQEKTEIKTEAHTKSPSKDLSSEKKSSKKPKEQRARSCSAERDRRHGHPESKPGGCRKEKDKATPSRCSRSKERRRTHTVSDSSQSKSPDRTSKKRRRSRSQSKEKRRSRSSSTSRERSRLRKHKPSRERNDDKEERRRTSKDKKRDRSRSKSRSRSREKKRDRSPSKSRSRSREKKRDRARSRSRSREKKHDRSRSKSRSRSREKKRDRARSKSRSRSREKKRDRSRSKSRSRSREKKRDRSRSKSRSRSREKKRDRARSKSRSRSREKKHDRSRSKSRSRSREKKRDRARSKSRSRSREKKRDRSRSKSRSRSREKKHGRNRSKSKSRSTSRSREKRKDRARYPSSRDKVESHSKEKRRHRSRSSSREKRKETSSVKSQKTSDSNSWSTKDKKTSRDRKKVEDSNDKAGNPSRINKPEPPSSSISPIKKERKKLKVEEQTTAEDPKNKTCEIKKEKCPSLDMFEESTIDKLIKNEETDTPVTVAEGTYFKQEKCFKEETLEDPIKTEICEADQVESKSPERCHSIPVLSDSTTSPNLTAGSTPSPTQPQDVSEEPSSEVSTVTAEQEVQQPSDSDDDFNIDVMLDSLGIVKLKSTEGAKVKQEREENEKKSEGEQAVVGAKSKTQVKRVTWNIQEPEGPQPEKSASKVALYKLKLKQEGLRRPSSAASSSSQDLTGTVTVGELLKAGADPQSSSGSDSTHQETSEADDGDVLKKDKHYLKKLHMQERAVEEVKLAIKPFYQKREINKDEYKDILRKAVQKVCHSKSGEINPVKVGNLVKAYVDKYKHARKHRKGEDSGRLQAESMRLSDSP